MSDVESTPAPIEETPAATEQTIDWQKRYEDIRPEFDRTNQALSQYQSLVDGLQSEDPDTRAEAALALGFELVDGAEEEVDEPVDQDTELARQVAELNQWRAQQQQDATEQQQLAQVEAHVDAQMGALEGLDEADRDWVLSRALALDPDDQGMPDVRAAFADLVARDTRKQQAWGKTKKAPSISAVGQEGTQAPNLDNDHERQQWMAERLEQLSQ